MKTTVLKTLTIIATASLLASCSTTNFDNDSTDNTTTVFITGGNNVETEPTVKPKPNIKKTRTPVSPSKGLNSKSGETTQGETKKPSASPTKPPLAKKETKTAPKPAKKATKPKVVKKQSQKILSKEERLVQQYGETCEEIVKNFRPNVIGKNFPIKCVGGVDGSKGNSGNSNSYGGTDVSVYSDGSYKPIAIHIKRGLSPYITRGIITHETYHALSFRWSAKKQKAFLRSLGATDWTEGSYLSQPAEMWANTAAACDGYTYRSSYVKLPGGCATVRKWINN